MERYEAFKPGGDCQLVAGAAPAPGAQRVIGPASGMVNYLIGNLSSTDMWLCFGQTSTAALNGAVIPTANAPQKVLFIKAGVAPRVFTFQAQPFVAAVTAAGTGSVVITPGDGI